MATKKKKIKEKKQLAFQKKSAAAFRALGRAVYRHRHKARKKYPSRSNESFKKRGRWLIRFLDKEPKTIEFLDAFIGTEAMNPRTKGWRRKVLELLSLYLLNKITLREASKLFVPIAAKSYEVIALDKQQNKIQKTLPPEIMAFLPSSIIVEVDKNNNIKGINDMFVNDTYTLKEKIKTQKKLVYRYNTIVKQVKKDMKSRDEITKLCALVTSIIMETGIRPGKIGNSAVKIIEDKKIEVETFGAVSLNADHVSFVKNNFAELKFVGKKGGLNTASLKDSEVIKVLKDYVDNSLKSGSKYIFTTREGQQFDYKDLSSYFRKNFKGFKITDFRKLRATRTVFEVLKEERRNMLGRIKEIASGEVDSIKAKATEEIVKTIELAHQKAQAALSHMDSSTTQDAYINPQVLLRFLSTAKIESSFRDYIMQGKTKFRFDPMMFVKEAEKLA
jgi:DNA topoisomerase IB